jgi:hypothetical protein
MHVTLTHILASRKSRKRAIYAETGSIPCLTHLTILATGSAMRTVDVVVSTNNTMGYEYLLKPGEFIVKAVCMQEETQEAIDNGSIWEDELKVRVYIDVALPDKLKKQ